MKTALSCLLLPLLLCPSLGAQEPARAIPLEELAVLRDPAFRTRFMQSYFSETEIEPTLTDEERVHMQEVLDAIGKENLATAIDLLERRRQGASSAVFDFTLGNLFFQQEEWDQAVAAYENALAKHPKYLRAWRNLAQIRVRQGDARQALRALSRVVELGGADAATYGLVGSCHALLESHLAAESAFRLAHLLDPQTADWKMGLLRAFYKQQRWADVLALTREMLAAEPERGDLWLLQANAFLGLDQPMRAAENYEIVDQLGQSTFDSLATLADVYVNAELDGLAVDAHLRALEIGPTADPSRALRAARVLSSRGSRAELRRLLERLETLEPARLAVEQRRDLLRLRARQAVADGAGGEEKRVLEEMVQLDPLDGEALILLGQHAVRSSDPAQAIFYFERAAGLERFEADAKVRHAQLLVSQGKYDEALPLLRRAQQVRPRENVQAYLDQVERVARTRS